ncbi:hypothetical protein ACFLXA_02730 [Chloroflexota bacterium]
MNDCRHYWICSTPYKAENGDRVTHEVCRYCGGKRDLIENKERNGKVGEVQYGYHYTEIKYPKEVEDMNGEATTFTKENFQARKAKEKEYKDRKDDIIQVFRETKELKATAFKLGIPMSSLRSLLIKWQVYKVGDRGASISSEQIRQDDRPSLPPIDKIPQIKNSDLVPAEVVDKIVEYMDIDHRQAKAFWNGFKMGAGIGASA